MFLPRCVTPLLDRKPGEQETPPCSLRTHTCCGLCRLHVPQARRAPRRAKRPASATRPRRPTPPARGHTIHRPRARQIYRILLHCNAYTRQVLTYVFSHFKIQKGKSNTKSAKKRNSECGHPLSAPPPPRPAPGSLNHRWGLPGHGPVRPRPRLRGSGARLRSHPSGVTRAWLDARQDATTVELALMCARL